MELYHSPHLPAPGLLALSVAALLFGGCSPGSVASATARDSESATSTATPTAAAAPTVPPDRSLTPTIGGRPANDNPPGLAITSLPFSHSEDVRQAQIHAMEMASTCGSGAQSVWFSFTAEDSAKLVADTFGSDYDTILDIYEGSLGSDLQNPGFEGLVPLACNDNAANSGQSEVVFGATAGTRYVVRVTSGLNSLGGNLTFHLAQG